MNKDTRTRGQILGVVEGYEDTIKAPTTNTLYDRLARSLPDVPVVPGGLATPVIVKAVEAASAAIEVADDTLSDNYNVLVQAPEALADQAYRQALAKGTKGAKYDADPFRAKRIEVEHQFNGLVAEARKAVAGAKRVISDETVNLIPIANERYAKAADAWREAEAALKAARLAFANAAQGRADLVTVAGEDKAIGLMNAEAISRDVALHVTGPSNADAVETIRQLTTLLESLGAKL